MKHHAWLALGALANEYLSKKDSGIIGYTHAKESNNPATWHNSALLFNKAAAVLYREVPGEMIRPCAFNAALSLELILKAILAKLGQAIPPHHDLIRLVHAAGIKINEDQAALLDHFTRVFAWVGRYPAPLREEAWDEYLDDLEGKRVIRGKSRNNTYFTRANPKAFPSLENYTAIWVALMAEFEKRGHVQLDLNEPR